MLLDNVFKMSQVYGAAKAKKLAAHDNSTIEDLSEHISAVKDSVEKMVEARKVANKIKDEKKKAIAYQETVLSYFDTIRYHADKLEMIVDDEMWTLPKYRELLFIR